MLIKNATVHIGNGEIRGNSDVLIKSGKIARIGQDLNSEEEGRILDAEGLHLFPGFIDPMSSIGSMDKSYRIKDTDEFSKPVTPLADVRYAFNPDEIMLEELYKVGITAIGAAPGNANVIGGKMAAFRTWGHNVNKMLIRDFTGLKGSVSHNVKSTYGSRNVLKTRMGIFRELKKFLGSGAEGPHHEVLRPVLRGEVPLFITANTKAEIDALIHIVRDYPIRLVICNAYQAQHCAEGIRSIDASLIMGEQVYLSKNVYNDIDLAVFGGLKTRNNHLSFTISGDWGPSGRVKYLWNAIRFFQAGLDAEEVVRLMTSEPAALLGIEDRVGQVAEGLDADLVLYTSHPVKFYDARVRCTLIQGEIVYEEEPVCF